MTVSNKWMNDSDKIVRIFVVRHGQTEWNIKRILQGHSNIPINETGKQQAALLGKRLKDYEFDYVITSDLKRCLQTLAQVLGEDRFEDADLNIKKTKNFRERYMGDVEGMHIQDAREKFGPGFRDRGETRDSMLKRMDGEWERLLTDSVDCGYKNVLMCAHGGVITNFFNYLHHEKNYKLGSDLKAEDLKVPYNTSLTIVDVTRNDLSDGTIQVWASTAHLGGVKSVADQQLV
ncbi:DEKNAAC105623 [Brettanomyces naardenensis]|uniref:DEKNAAC105623 n=1 Tax=Brettanomyces naardenensis TaxID=13370 RepID=A0A448YTT9_BRENA|nr:DEKNAAC105623 [Brettanomyces naardenensis]